MIRTALQEEIELETAARRYEQFYIRLLDERNQPLMTTPGMAEQMDLEQLARQTRSHPGVTIRMKGRHGRAFRVTTATGAGRLPSYSDRHDSDCHRRLAAGRIPAHVTGFGSLAFCWGRLPFFRWSDIRLHDGAFGRWKTWQRLLAASVRPICGSGFSPTVIHSSWHRWPAPSTKCSTAWKIRSNESPDSPPISRTTCAHLSTTFVAKPKLAWRERELSTEYREVLESCLEEAVRLSDLIGNLLFLARAESPLTHLRREPVDVVELLDGMREYYEASAAEAGIYLTTSAAGAPVIAELDRTLIQRAVSNLVSNAVAHTPSGRIGGVGCHCRSSAVRIEVTRYGRRHSSGGAAQSL